MRALISLAAYSQLSGNPLAWHPVRKRMRTPKYTLAE
jgi:hypothetical protein